MTLRELKAECSKLGLTVVQSGKREARSDYLLALRAHYLFHDFPDGLPYDELSPMLCYSYQDLHQDEQEKIWKDGNQWIAQEKINGVRVILHFIERVGVFAQSRVVSLKNFRRADLTDHLLFSDFVPNFSAVVDAEAIVSRPIDTTKGKITKSSLQSTTAVLRLSAEASKRLQQEQSAPLIFHAFDLVSWQGQDLRQKKLCERLSYFTDFRAAINSAPLAQWLEFPPIILLGKSAFHDKIIKAGGEGVVLKHLNGAYNDSGRRSRSGWVKVKQERQFDCFVSGFVPGKPGTKWERQVAVLDFSVRTETGDHTIAKIVNIPKSFRRKISVYDQETKQVTLHPQMFGRVACLSGVEIAQRSFRLSNPRILRWYRLQVENPCFYPLATIKGAVSEPDPSLPFGETHERSGDR